MDVRETSNATGGLLPVDSSGATPTVLSPEEYEAVDLAQASFERGEGMTVEEAFLLARKRTRAWQATPHKDQAA